MSEGARPSPMVSSLAHNTSHWQDLQCGAGSQLASADNDTTHQLDQCFSILFPSLSQTTRVNWHSLTLTKDGNPQGQQQRASFLGCLKALKDRRVARRGLSVGRFLQTPQQESGSPPSATSSPTPCPETCTEDLECVSYGERHTPRSWRIRQGLDTRASRPARSNVSQHMAPKHLKCEQSELSCAPSVKYMPGFEDLWGEKKREFEIAH